MNKKSTKLLILPFLAVLFVGFAVGSFSFAPAEDKGQQVFTISGVGCISHVRDGVTLKTECKHNTVTNLGLNHTRDLLAGFYIDGSGSEVGNTNWTVMELSTDGGAPATTDTVCPSVVTGGGLDLKQADIVIRQPASDTLANYTISNTWSVTGTQAGIQKMCISNDTTSAAGNALMSSLTFSSTNVENGDTFIGNYSLAVTNG